MLDSSDLDGLLIGHPLLLADFVQMVYYRFHRMSPHSGDIMVFVAEESGGIIAVDPSELSFLDDES